MRAICAFSSSLSLSDLSPCHLLLCPHAAFALPLPVPPPPSTPARAPAPVASKNARGARGQCQYESPSLRSFPPLIYLFSGISIEPEFLPELGNRHEERAKEGRRGKGRGRERKTPTMEACESGVAIKHRRALAANLATPVREIGSAREQCSLREREGEGERGY